MMVMTYASQLARNYKRNTKGNQIPVVCQIGQLDDHPWGMGLDSMSVTYYNEHGAPFNPSECYASISRKRSDVIGEEEKKKTNPKAKKPPKNKKQNKNKSTIFRNIISPDCYVPCADVRSNYY